MPPECKGSYARSLLAAVDTLGGSTAAAIRHATPPEAIARIESAVATEWIPFEHYQAVAEAVRKELGDAQNRRFWHKVTARNFASPLLHHLIEGAVRVFGMSPAGLLKIAPRGRDLMVRGCGTLTFTNGSELRSGVLVLDHFPPSLFATGTTLEIVGATFEGFFEIAHTRGTVTVTEQDPTRARAVFLVRWA
jgi:hypothetical protein